MSQDLISQTPESVVNQVQKPALVAKYNEILSETSTYHQEHNKWKENNKVLEKSGKESTAEPEKSELCRLGDIYQEEAAVYSRNVVNAMRDATATLSSTFNKTSEEVAEMNKEGESRVKLAIQEIGNYSGEETEQGIVGLFRATRVIEELNRDIPSYSKFEHIADLVVAYPDTLHTCQNIFSGFVANQVTWLQDRNSNPFPKDEPTTRLLGFIANKDFSPLPEAEQKNAKLLLHESAGYNLYEILKDQKIETMTPETIEKVTNGLVAQEVWNLINAESVDTLAEKIGGLSRKDGQENREEFQALALGMIRATLDTARTIKADDPKFNADGLRLHAAKGLLALTDPKTESILQIKEDNHHKYVGFLYDEIKNIYAANQNQFASQEVAKLLWQRNKEVVDIQYEPTRIANEQEAEKRRKDLAAVEATKKENADKLMRTYTQALLNDPQLLFKIKSSCPLLVPDTRPIFTDISNYLYQKRESLKTDPNYADAVKILYAFNRHLGTTLPTISGHNLSDSEKGKLNEMYYKSDYTVVDRPGILGVGKVTHEEQEVGLTAPYLQRLNGTIESLQNKEKRTPEEEATLLAHQLLVSAYKIEEP